MLPEQLLDFNCVQTYDNIILVGERHDDDRSCSIIQSVLETVETVSAISIERDRPIHDSNGSHGMVMAEQFAIENNCDRYYIDKPPEHIYQAIDNTAVAREEVIRLANKFSIDLTEKGDVNISAISDARRRVRILCGKSIYDAIYTDREIHMARKLKWLSNQYNQPVICVIGVFHIFALCELIDLLEDTTKPRKYDSEFGKQISLSINRNSELDSPDTAENTSD